MCPYRTPWRHSEGKHRYSRTASTKSQSFCMITYSVSLTNLMVLLLQSRYTSYNLSSTSTALTAEDTFLRAHNFAPSPGLWRHTRLTNVTCTWSWRLCGINLLYSSTQNEPRHKRGWEDNATPQPALAHWKSPSIHFTEGWVGPIVGMNEWGEEKNLFPPPGFEPQNVRCTKLLYWLRHTGLLHIIKQVRKYMLT